jgi:hypothetical protein
MQGRRDPWQVNCCFGVLGRFDNLAERYLIDATYAGRPARSKLSHFKEVACQK